MKDGEHNVITPEEWKAIRERLIKKAEENSKLPRWKWSSIKGKMVLEVKKGKY